MSDEPRSGSDLGAEPLANENLKFLENIEVELSVEVGRTEITIREL